MIQFIQLVLVNASVFLKLAWSKVWSHHPPCVHFSESSLCLRDLRLWFSTVICLQKPFPGIAGPRDCLMTYSITVIFPQKLTKCPALRKLSVWLCVLVAQSCLTLCDSMGCSPPGSSVHGILQTRILKWMALPFSRGSSQPRDWIWVSRTAGRFLTIWTIWEALRLPWKLTQETYPVNLTLSGFLLGNNGPAHQLSSASRQSSQMNAAGYKIWHAI